MHQDQGSSRIRCQKLQLLDGGDDADAMHYHCTPTVTPSNQTGYRMATMQYQYAYRIILAPVRTDDQLQ